MCSRSGKHNYDIDISYDIKSGERDSWYAGSVRAFVKSETKENGQVTKLFTQAKFNSLCPTFTHYYYFISIITFMNKAICNLKGKQVYIPKMLYFPALSQHS